MLFQVCLLLIFNSRNRHSPSRIVNRMDLEALMDKDLVHHKIIQTHLSTLICRQPRTSILQETTQIRIHLQYLAVLQFSQCQGEQEESWLLIPSGVTECPYFRVCMYVCYCILVYRPICFVSFLLFNFKNLQCAFRYCLLIITES